MNSRLPVVSIIIPSYNQAPYLEETLLSIINQNYPNLELLVIDGGSSDGSVNIIKNYEAQIAYWVSEPDRGQSHAINKGLEKATGEWVAWMNSDDCYLPGALHYIFQELPHAQYDFIYGNTCCGSTIATAKPFEFYASDKNSLYKLLKFFYSVKHIIPSQSVFVRRNVLQKAGLLDESLDYCMDLDWYCRIFLHTDKRYFYEKTLSFFRMTETNKSGKGNHQGWKESILIAEKYAPYLSRSKKQSLKRYLDYAIWIREAREKDPLLLEAIWGLLKFRFIAWQHPAYRIYLRKVLQLG
jgi:glycosyltransferase involved in cell wall biosynthesis